MVIGVIDEAVIGISNHSQSTDNVLAEDGWYIAPQDVADYLHTYAHLPDNFITKNEAKKMGWDSQTGNLVRITPDIFHSLSSQIFSYCVSL